MADNENTTAPVEIKLVDTENIPAPDELVISLGNADTYTIKLATEGEYKRGMLLMSGADGFVKATKTGAASAGELAILADDIELSENEYANVNAYFGGVFKGTSIIISDESESDDHAALLEGLSAKFRAQKILVK